MSINIVDMIQKITFEQILDVWRNHLWPNRVSAIESTSAMNFLGGYDLKNMKYEPTFLACTIDNKIAGVNSGHKCYDGSYRIRGLYTFSEFRKQGIAYNLIMALVAQASKESCSYVWAYPRETSLSVFLKAGFKMSSTWIDGETGKNVYCDKQI